MPATLRLLGNSMKHPGGPLLRRLTGHTHFIGSLVAMPGNRILVSSSEDGTIRVWDLATGESLQVLDAHKSAVNCIARNAAGTRLVSASDDHTIKVWDTKDWSVLRTIEGHTGYVSRVAVTPTDGIISCGRDNTVRIWDMETGRQFASFDWKNWVTEIALSPDGFIAVCSSVDNVMKVYDVEHAKELRVLVDASSGFTMVPGFDLFIPGANKSGIGHDSGPTDIAFTPDGKRVVSVEKELIVWDFETGKELSRQPKRAWGWNALLVTPSGRVFAGSKTVQIQEADGRIIAEMHEHTDDVKSLALTPDGKILASGGGDRDKSICVWNIASALELGVAAFHSSHVTAVAISPDGTRGLTGANDGTARMWDLATGAQLHVFAHASPFASQVGFTPDGKRAITCWNDGTMRIWDAATGAAIGELKHKIKHYSFNAFAIAPDGRFALVGEVSTDFTRWDLTGASAVPVSAEGKLKHVQALLITRDGKRAIASGYVDPKAKNSKGPLQVRDAETGRILSEMLAPGTYYPKVALSADERFAWCGTNDGQLHVWDLETGKSVREIAAHPGCYVKAVELLPDGTVATVAMKEKVTQFRVWDAATGAEVRRLDTPASSTRDVVFALDGSFALLAAEVLSVWDLATGEIVATFKGENEIFCVALAPDQRTILAGEREGRVHVLRLERS